MTEVIHDRYFVVAELNNKIVGTGALKDNEIRSVFVNPAYQKKEFSALSPIAGLSWFFQPP